MSLFNHPTVLNEIERMKNICKEYEEVEVYCGSISENKNANITVSFPVKGHNKLIKSLKDEGCKISRIRKGNEQVYRGLLYEMWVMSSKTIDLYTA